MQTRVCKTNVTATAFALAAGRVLASDINDRVFSMRRSNGGIMARGYQFQVIGSGADNSTGSYRQWRVQYGPSKYDAELTLQSTGTFALSAAVGVGTEAGKNLVLLAERYADTLANTVATNGTTPKGIGDLIVTATGAAAAQVYTPQNDTPGMVIVPDAGDCDAILPELILGSAWGYANCIMSHLD